jgi:hypothetical protein
MPDILTDFIDAGFTFKLDSNQIVVTPASALTATQRAFLKANKAQIIKLLSPQRPVISFKLHNNQAGTCLGGFGDSAQEIIDALTLRYGERLLSASLQNQGDKC